jgi:SAM-dependent methyltransferase
MPSMREVMRCRDEITKLDPIPEWLSNYRNMELYFWLRIPQWIYEDVANHKIERCLDIGCGAGTIALYCHKLTGCEVYCVDCNENLSKSLIEKYNFHYDINNMEVDSFPYNVKFDIIIFTEVLEHFNIHPVPTLKKIGNLRSEKGKLYLSTPDGGWFQWGKITKYIKQSTICPFREKDCRPPIQHVTTFTNTLNENCWTFLMKQNSEFKDLIILPGHLGYRHFNLVLTKKENAHKTQL